MSLNEEQSKPRRTRIGAYGLVLRDEALLLCRLSAAVPRWAGLWTLPGGGINFGEAPKAAVLREVHEETGIEVRVREIAFVDSIHDTTRATDFHGIRIVYRADYVRGSLRDELAGTTDTCRWVTLAQARALELYPLAADGLAHCFGEHFLGNGS